MLDSRTDRCLFVRYPKMSFGYHFHNPSERKVFVSSNTTFLEENYSLKDSKTKKTLEEQVPWPIIMVNENNEKPILTPIKPIQS